ncbi:hypothetical protein [Actinomycetospora sp. CA-084318]|uniref:hypothetical protein n=1 Tax=Actinomycetospora sp. CA-084318 TaxID=3239892 RepID=UPI003D98CBDD
MTEVGIVLRGTAGANGDRGATGGRGGFVTALVPTTPGGGLQIVLGSPGDSYHPGGGFRNGGEGQQSTVYDDAGGGGGASSVSSNGTLYMVAGGGGGAGGAPLNDPGVAIGGNGGDAGAPADDGAQGGDSSNINGVNGGTGGGGGCADGRIGGDQCQQPQGQNDGNGGRGEAPHQGDVLTIFQASGAGGGAGWPNGGGGGQAAHIGLNPLVQAGGGGGAGGQNFVGNGAELLAQGITPDNGASITFFAAGGPVFTASCNGSSEPRPYTPPVGTTAVLAVAQGGTGSPTGDPVDTGPAGRGAITVGTIPVVPGQRLAVVPGCQGYGRGISPGAGIGGDGGSAPCLASRNGGGGGGGSTVFAGGRSLLTAGGGGGSGGNAVSALNQGQPTPGGAGGDAGLGWGRAGAGDGAAAGGGGGKGGFSAQPAGRGDTGSHAVDNPCSGGGGGGGGGGEGAEGGDAGYASGGGGGGAGTSTFQAGAVRDPVVGSASRVGDGFVKLLAVDPIPYNNTALAVPGTAGPGFDGVGNVYDIDAVTKAGRSGDTDVYFGQIGGVFGWNSPPGSPDNWAQDGQTIPIARSGPGIVVFGASTSGPTAAVATVRFSDGTSQPVTISFPDWTRPFDLAPNVQEVFRVPRSDGTQVSVYGQYIPSPPGKTAVSLTLPPANPGGPTAPTSHVFKVEAGDPD